MYIFQQTEKNNFKNYTRRTIFFSQINDIKYLFKINNNIVPW